jgi:hypothetical protein
VEIDVVVEDAGEDPAELRASVDAAYRAKYGRDGASAGGMVTDDAAATTLRLIPERDVQAPDGLSDTFVTHA